MFDPVVDFLGSDYNEVEDSINYIKQLASCSNSMVIMVVYPKDNAKTILRSSLEESVVKGYTNLYNSSRVVYYLTRCQDKLGLFNVKNNWGVRYDPSFYEGQWP